MTHMPVDADLGDTDFMAAALEEDTAQTSAVSAPQPTRSAAGTRWSPATGIRRPPGEAWMARWPIAVGLAVVGLLAGYAWAGHQPVTYTSEARVAVGAGDLSSGAIAGFPEAAEALAANYARYINDTTLSGSSGVALSASPIPDSSIIRVDGVSTERDQANAQVQNAAEDLVAQVKAGQKQGDALAAYKKSSEAWSQAETTQGDAQADVARLRGKADVPQVRLNAALARLTRAISGTDVAALLKSTLGAAYNSQQNASAAADLKVVVPASTVSSNGRSLHERYALLGGVAGLALSLVVAVALERRTSRRRRAA